MSRLVWLLPIACAVSCGRDGAAVEAAPEARGEGWPAPSGEDGDRTCADVGDARACWGGEGAQCAEGVCLVDRALPDAAPVPGGWRCHGHGPERRCVSRRLRAGPFACDGDHCIQDYPRLPDSSFWECIDDEGVVVCRGGEPAAGVFPAEPDPAWTCGSRRGEQGQRVCVDPSPDLPRGERGWRCYFEHQGGERRLCERHEGAPGVGAACDDGAGCVRGAVCAGGRCLPARLAAECWLDADCGEGRWCRFGACMEGGT